MNILGVGGVLGDAAAAVIKDGEIAAAIEDIKLTRRAQSAAGQRWAAGRLHRVPARRRGRGVSDPVAGSCLAAFREGTLGPERKVGCLVAAHPPWQDSIHEGLWC